LLNNSANPRSSLESEKRRLIASWRHTRPIYWGPGECEHHAAVAPPSRRCT